ARLSRAMSSEFGAAGGGGGITIGARSVLPRLPSSEKSTNCSEVTDGYDSAAKTVSSLLGSEDGLVRGNGAFYSVGDTAVLMSNLSRSLLASLPRPCFGGTNESVDS